MPGPFFSPSEPLTTSPPEPIQASTNLLLFMDLLLSILLAAAACNTQINTGLPLLMVPSLHHGTPEVHPGSGPCRQDREHNKATQDILPRFPPSVGLGAAILSPPTLVARN